MTTETVLNGARNEPGSIDHVMVTENVNQSLATLITKGNERFHDILVLIGLTGQHGPTRIADCINFWKSPQQNTIIDIFLVAKQVSEDLRKNLNYQTILGIATASANKKDIYFFLSLGVPFYYSGGLNYGLNHTGVFAERGFYVQGKDGQPIIVPRVSLLG